ncbi:protein of unknown function [Kyrpidia spormannii]|uniref:Uncharacterized protein n=2 Tax=Kyrpidia spormannii TaxID=2055160 RepID=A0ACA8Z975_9BACL|nr:protein of unknown function [Kyrpidia spormannii]CAB3392681.1 protein of unknown function [Kyrpidia spormannii]
MDAAIDFTPVPLSYVDNKRIPEGVKGQALGGERTGAAEPERAIGQRQDFAPMCRKW